MMRSKVKPLIYAAMTAAIYYGIIPAYAGKRKNLPKWRGTF